MTNRDIAMTGKFAVPPVVKGDDGGGWPEHEAKAIAAALEPFMAFCREIANSDSRIPQWIRKGAAAMIAPEPSEDFGQDWRP